MDVSVPELYIKILQWEYYISFIEQDEMLNFGHYICDNWQLLYVIILLSIERVNG